MSSLEYVRIETQEDPDIPLLLRMHQIPEIARFISISDNYFFYVANTENVFFYKVYENGRMVGSIHLEMQEKALFMDILVFPEFQKMGIGTTIIRDVQRDVFGLGYKQIEISVDERNVASRIFFEKAGFRFVSKDEELRNYFYVNVDDDEFCCSGNCC